MFRFVSHTKGQWDTVGHQSPALFYTVHISTQRGERSVVIVVRHSTQQCLFLAHGYDPLLMWTCAIVAEGEIVFPSYSSSPNYTAQIKREGSPQWEITNQDHLRHVQVMTFCFPHVYTWLIMRFAFEGGTPKRIGYSLQTLKLQKAMCILGRLLNIWLDNQKCKIKYYIVINIPP